MLDAKVPAHFGTPVRIMKHWVRMIVVKVAVMCILKYNHFYYCYYYNPYPVLHNPNPSPKVWVPGHRLEQLTQTFIVRLLKTYFCALILDCKKASE